MSFIFLILSFSEQLHLTIHFILFCCWLEFQFNTSYYSSIFYIIVVFAVIFAIVVML